MIKFTPHTYKLAGVIVATIPIGFLILFMFGEVVGGDAGGFGHLIQILPLTIFVILAWRRPLIGSSFLIATGTILGFLYGKAAQGRAVETTVLVELFFFVTLVISGICFLFSRRKK